jgi:hypothetical protein
VLQSGDWKYLNQSHANQKDLVIHVLKKPQMALYRRACLPEVREVVAFVAADAAAS